MWTVNWLVDDAGQMRRPLAWSMFWQVFSINALVFALGTIGLVLSPATVSSDVLRSELIVVCAGLSLLLCTNGLLLRASLQPLDRLTRLMATVDLLEPGHRLS